LSCYIVFHDPSRKMTENTAKARTFSKSFDENISMAYWGGGEGCGRPGGKMGGKVNILNLKN